MSVASKNLFALLGNDDEGSETPAPVKTVTKGTISTAKANVDGTSKAASAARTTGNRAGFTDAQKNFRDNVGRAANQSRTLDEQQPYRPRGGRGARGRGGHGATRHRNADDRHAKNIAPGSEKQAAQSWGAADGDAELKDEEAGEAIAQSEQKAAEAEDAEAESQEPETKQLTLDQYLAKLKVDRADAGLDAAQKLRKANEGAKKKEALVAIEKEDLGDYAAPVEKGSKKKKEKAQKNIVEWDGSWKETPREGGGGRGGFRGDFRGGERRGGAPRGRGGAPRGDGAPRGAPRGGAPRGGAPRGGGRGGPSASGPVLNDNDFPSLG